MPSIIRFFDALKPRVCVKCNQALPEMADCYSNVCPNCDSFTYYDIQEGSYRRQEERE